MMEWNIFKKYGCFLPRSNFKLYQCGKNIKYNDLDETRDSIAHSTRRPIDHDDPVVLSSSANQTRVPSDDKMCINETLQTFSIDHRLPMISIVAQSDQFHRHLTAMRYCYHWVHHQPYVFSIALGFIMILMFFTPALLCIKVVSLNVPPHVRKGSDLELSCLFDLGNATLYSLKWFYRAHEWDREEQEFFRYTPRHKPYKQVFPLEGIHVDLSKSSGSVVYIRQANSKTSGKYKCEISVEETFQTVAAEKLMTVFNSYSSLQLRNYLFYVSSLFSFVFTMLIFG